MTATFVSCIKVKGINLLPPVITPELCIEIASYKQQAIKIEERLKKCRLSSTNIILDRPQSAITFGDSSHIEDLGITSARSNKVQIRDKVNPSKDIGEAQTPSPRKSPKGGLLQSNSYTLESPSPVLLAHLEKCSTTEIEEPVLSRMCTSLENNYVPFEQSKFSSLNTVYNFNEKPEVYGPDKTIEPEKDSSSTIEVIQTDISVQQITLNANTDRIEPVKTTFGLTDSDSQLMEVLKKIPDVYSKQIIELMEKQKADHSVKVENFGKQFSRNYYCSTPVRDHNKNTVVPSFIITDFNICEEEEKKGLRENDSKNNEFGRDLFSNNYRNIDDIKREWAASVICAHVRGYLTRRLLKTKKVQSLIETIHDSLICASQLHSVKNIEEADIKLHRSLVKQVKAGFYAIHDIFFALSIPEKMSVISTDRKRKMKNSPRPRSTVRHSTPVADSSRSLTRLTKI